MERGNERIVGHYCHVHPEADEAAVFVSYRRLVHIVFARVAQVMKAILFLVNDRHLLKTTGTNWTLMRACQSLGMDVFSTDVNHLEARSAASLHAEAIRVPTQEEVSGHKKIRLEEREPELVELTQFSTIFIRTTPGRDIARSWAHRLALEVMRLASELGINVLNDPAGLQKASSKLYSVYLPPEYAPRTKVCHTYSSVVAFAEELACPFVIKPLLGSQGRDVYFFDGVGCRNLRQIIDNLGQTGYLVVQEFLPEATEGDIRVITLNGGIFGGSTAHGIKRTPGTGEIRSNISLGGRASLIELNPGQIQICTTIAQQLNSDGIRLAGLDLIGNKIVEVNVFSPSGLQELEPSLPTDDWNHLVDQLLAGLN